MKLPILVTSLTLIVLLLIFLPSSCDYSENGTPYNSPCFDMLFDQYTESTEEFIRYETEWLKAVGALDVELIQKYRDSCLIKNTEIQLLHKLMY